MFVALQASPGQSLCRTIRTRQVREMYLGTARLTWSGAQRIPLGLSPLSAVSWIYSMAEDYQTRIQSARLCG